MIEFPVHKIRIKLGSLILHLIEQIFSLLPKSMNLVVLNSLTRALGITGIAYNGDQGEFFGNPHDRHIFGKYVVSNSYSPELLTFITDFFRQHGGGTCIDVGANIGLISIPVAKTGIDCICFEPDPRNFHMLNINTDVSNVKNKIKLHNIALYNRQTNIDFEISPSNAGDNRVRILNNSRKNFYNEQSWKVISVPTERMDDVLDTDNMQRPILVKIDTQGAEVPIFKGGAKFLSQADIIIFEYSPYHARRQNSDERFLVDFIQEHFLSACVIESGKNWDVNYEPISAINSKLREFSDAYPHLRYVDVLVKK